MKTPFISKIQSQIIKSTFIRFCVILFLTLSFAYSTFAQNPSTKRGFTPGNSFAIGDFEAINTTNGNVMMKFPLAQLPVGRNGLTTGLYLTYNSKMYDTYTEYIENTLETCLTPESGCYYQKQRLKLSAEGGWQWSFGYRLAGDDRTSQYFGLPNQFQPSCNSLLMRYSMKLYIAFPDGSKHEMIPYGYVDQLNDGFYNIRADGVINGGCGNDYNTGIPMTYYSVDGTYLRLEFNNDGDLNGANNTWTLYFPDGTKLTGGGDNNPYAKRMYDRNNNYIDVDTLTDQFGRSIVRGHDSQTGEDTVTVKGTGGEDLVWRIRWKSIYVNKKFIPYSIDTINSCQGQSCPPNTDPEPVDQWFDVVDKITLPSQAGSLTYTFSYNAHNIYTTQESVGFGELSGVTLPSGAQVSYSYYWDNQPVDINLLTADVLKNKITGKTLTYTPEYDGLTSQPVTETWVYGIGNAGSSITAPDGGVTWEYFGYTEVQNANTGLSFATIQPDGTMIERLWGQNVPVNKIGWYPLQRNPYIKTEFTSIKDKNGTYTLTAIKDYSYDKNGNVTQVAEYDWQPYANIPRDAQGKPTSIPSGITPKRITATGYAVTTNDASSSPTVDTNLYVFRSSPRLRSTPMWSEVRNGSNQAVTRTEMFYDGATSLTQIPTAGNLTESRSWDSTKGSYSDPLTTNNSISVSTTYNQYGMPLTTTDAKGTVTQITYGNIQGPNGNVSDLYPTQTITAYGTSLQKTAQMEYDFYTGAFKKTIDVDNNVSTSTTYDALGRSILVKSAEGTAVETRTATEYNDVGRYVIVRSDLNTTGDSKQVSIQHYDQLGRVRLSRSLEDSATQSATNEQDGIKVQTRYAFSGNYSYALSSNPYRATTSTAATGETTMGWSRSKTNNKGQLIEVETFSGTSLPAPFGSNSNSTGKITTEEDANTTTVTDQAGKKRKSETNALDQLVKVTEDPSSTGYTGLNYETTYSYDTRSNLIQINQGVQQRTFTYSSLSRLLTATNPESGTFTYTYDENGNLLTKTDARTFKTSYTYDLLNRALTKTYELCPQGQSCQPEGTPTVEYFYDGNGLPSVPDFSKGKMTKVHNKTASGVIVSAYEYTSFDALGRVTSSKQTTDGTAYPMSYSYNLGGKLTSQTYPSGRVVKQVFDNSGDVIQVFGKIQNRPIMTYANEFKYNAHGEVEGLRYGNNKWESTLFNSRLQITQVGLGTTQNATDFFKLDYTYGVKVNGVLDTTQNNSNLESQTITVSGMSNQFVQVYTYDALDRLSSSEEKSNNLRQWIQSFKYDRYGNREIDTDIENGESKTTASIVGPNPEISETDNRITPRQGEQYLYDDAGNLTKDKDGNTFVYDGENKLVTYNGGAGTSTPTGANYIYDGDGRRVKKVVGTGSTATIFVYDASGKLVAEYETNAPQTGGKIQYTTEDALGSPRVLTDQNGQVSSRRDFLPFGEEITGLGGRSSNYKYGQADKVRRKFTTYQRDEETDLDYAQARYYSSKLGRFTSPDEFSGGPEELYNFTDAASKNPTLYADITEPQSLNKYQYAYNNPYKYTDPTGHCVGWADCLRQLVTVGAPVAAPAAAMAGTAVSPVAALPALIIGGGYVVATTGRRTAPTYQDPWTTAKAPRPESIGNNVTPKATPATPAVQPTIGTPPNNSARPLPPPPPMESRAKNKVKPYTGPNGESAQGPHSTWKTDPKTGKKTGYTTWVPNPRNPAGWDPRKRVDVQGAPHGGVPTPHVHKGGKVRPARKNELP